MPEILVNHRPAPSDLRQRIRKSLPRLEADLQVVAEDILGHVSRIDFVARDGRGGAFVVLVSDDDADDGLLTRGLAQCAWLAPRLADWTKLAPESAFDADLPVQLCLIAPCFGAELTAAAGALGNPIVTLAAWRYLQAEHQRSVLLERVGAPGRASGRDPERARDEVGDDLAPRLAPFRSGIDDDDLGAPAAVPSSGTGRY